jgi:hypothetical protein
MLRRIVLVVFLVILSALSAFPCSIPTFGPTRFDISQYLFVGEVIGYVETTELINRQQRASEAEIYGEQANKTAGILVRVKGTFYTPREAKQTYEVFRFSLGADCGLYGLPLEWMKERYKIGDWVSVVAGKSEHIAQPTGPALERLEIRYGKSDWISITGIDDPNRRNISAEFDYRAYRSNLIGNPAFELLKDLRRLNLAGQSDRALILERLTYFPGRGLGLAEVFKAYSTDMNEFDRYSKLSQEREMSAEEFKRFEERRRTETRLQQ